ncbi:MAG: glycoside hydrolase family 6 protein [Solirubrobacteraceae bacterium]
MASAAAAATLAAALIVVAATDSSNAAGKTSAKAHSAFAQQCPDRYPAQRDPSNPLMLPAAPGPNPLHGANFFVDGPRHGAAASAIATLVGLNPNNYKDDYSWARFQDSLTRGSVANKLAHDSGLARKVALLSKIASRPESQRISIYSEGGSPAGIFGQTQKILCHNLTADAGSIPVFTTYFLHPAVGGCATRSQLTAAGPAFRGRVDAMAAATGNRPAVFLLEIDGVGSSRCMQQTGALSIWEADLKYEATKMGSLPHTVVYLEGGYSDANPPGYTARVLNAAGVRNIRGFFTNDTHINWTIDEIHWAQKVSAKTGGANFIVNTAQNGNEILCNPPGRAMGPPPTTTTGFAHADALLWTGPPGNSSGNCNGGPAAGTFWAARGIELASRAQAKLGPGFPADKY